LNKTEHLLTCLIEECAEIQKAAAKALRFGLDDHAPDEPEVTNSEGIAYECIDLYAVIEMLEEIGAIPRLTKPELIQQKKDKVSKYMEYAQDRGTIVSD
jgi:hypothetical protein